MEGVEFLRLILIFACLWRPSYAQELEFEGKELITFDLTERQIATEHLLVTFRFKTINPFGLILYSKGTQGDYIAIELVDGCLRYQADPGSTSGINSKQELMVGKDLADNAWHSVEAIWNRNKVNISIDSKYKKSTSFGSASFTKLNLDDKVFVGGVFEETNVEPALGLMSKNYIGCMVNFLFDDVNILYNAKYNRKFFRSYGDVKYHCRNFEYMPVSFPDYKSIIEIPTFVDKSLLLQLSFRSFLPNCMLLSKISNDSSVFLEIRGGKLVLRVESSKITAIKLEISSNINDGNWHAVECMVSAEMVSIKIDDVKPLVYRQPDLQNVLFNAPHITLGGGADNILRGFEGCMYRITVDRTFIVAHLLDKKRIKGALINKCNAMSKCWPNPCKNGGICKQSGVTGFQCDCTATLYGGKTCKDPLAKRSCHDYKSLGLAEDSYCHVDPDGPGPLRPFEVLCKVTKLKSAVTVVPISNGLRRINVSKSALRRGSKYYLRMIYPLAMENIFALINISSRCRQFVRYECKSSPLLNSPRGPPHVSWVNRYGIFENYWGGAPKGSDKCACGVTRTCTDSSKYCNCDMADNFWREDSGFLTDKEALPVTSIQFDASAVQSYFTAGDLECRNFDAAVPTSIAHSADALRACRPLIEKTTTTTSRPTTSYSPDLLQTEKILTRVSSRKDIVTKVTTAFERKGIITVHVKPDVKRTDGNSTSNAASDSGNQRHDGVTISMSILAVIVISASVVLVWAIIAVIVILKRRRRDSKRDESHDREQDNEEGTEMCIMFKQTKRDTSRPTIELRRDSYDSYDSVPTPALEYTSQTGFRQPITTHITLDYARAKKKKNTSAYFCS